LLPAAPALPAAVVPSRTTVARRALQVALLLGGFLALAFLFGGQAHADTPGTSAFPTASTVNVPSNVPLDKATQGTLGAATRSAAAGQAAPDIQGVRYVVTAVQRADGAAQTARQVTGLLGNLQQTARQVVSGVPALTGTIGEGRIGTGQHGANGDGSAVRRAAGCPHPAGVQAAPASRVTGLATAAQTDGRQFGARPMDRHRTSDRTPADPAGHSEHPCEGDSAHHTGTDYAALPLTGAQLLHSAVAPLTAHGSSPLKRPTDISVQPD
jgi:hypothetical protein